VAGQIVVSSIKTDSDNSISFLANTGATIFSANLASGLSASSFGNNTITSDKIVSVANTKITGNITSSQIVPNPVFNGNTTVTSLITESGITFPATQVASADVNTLDDYEEGTWTPVVVGTSTAGTASYVSQANAIYTKIGRAVTIQVWLEWSSGTGTGDLRMSGLPFTVNANYQAVPCVARMGPKITLTASNVLVTVFQQNTTQIVFNQYETGGSENATVAYDAAAGVFIAGTYTVA
jgi:hypothetical protein